MSESPNVYGYWIAKDEIIEVPYESHAEIAYEILAEQYNIPSKAVWDSPFTVYQFMFKLGYIRVVNEWGDSHAVQYHTSTKLSKLQKQFVKEASHEYQDHDNTPLDGLIIEEYAVAPIQQEEA